MDEYRTAFDQLNIPQEVFDQIITDDSARGEIHEFLVFCLTSVPSLSSIASVLLQYIACAGSSHSFDDEKWITINGTHVAVEEGSGAITKGPAALKEASAKKTGSDTPKRGESAFTPRIKDYAFEYEDEYTDGPVRISELDPSEQYEYWRQLNMEKLRGLFKEERQKEKETGVKRPDFQETVYHEWYGSKTENVTPDTVQEMSLDKAKDVLWDTIPDNVASGWLREANSAYKPRLVDCVIATPETRAAALNVMYENYKFFNGEGTSFEDFLTTPVRMYRGGQGQKHVAEDVFSSYTLDRKIAEKFAGKNGTVYEASIRPIDTWGSLRDNGEAEIMVPSWIAPNGNKDNADGGPGSGNFGHAGVPGQVGGSAPSLSSDEMDAVAYWKGGMDGFGYANIRAVVNGREAPAVRELKNNGLTERSEELRRKLDKLSKDFQSAIKKAPTADGKDQIRVTGSYVIPGVGKPEIGAEFTLEALTSFSTAPDDSREEIVRKFGAEGQIVFHMRGTTDFRDISKIADNVGGTGNEAEVVSEKPMRYRVTGIEERNYGGEYVDWLGKWSGGVNVQLVTIEPIADHTDGGPGSGNHGHSGVPGQVGVSAPGNGSRAVVNGSDISRSYSGKPDINSVMEAQGFTGWVSAGMSDGKSSDSSEKPLDFMAQSDTIKSRDQHHDADDVDWITVNGAHIPLKDGTAVGGGALEGQDFSASSSTSSSPSLAKAHWPDDFPKVTVHTNLQTLRHANPERHHAAKHGDTQAAKEIIAQCVKMERVEELAKKYPDAKVVPVRGEDTEEGNQIPMTFASCFEAFGLEVEDGIVQTKKAGHTDSDQFHRLMSRPEFDGKVEPGREYILVDDHVTNGGTLSDLRKYIVSNGGKVVAISTLSASQGGTYIAIQKKTVDQIRAKHGEGIDSLLRKGGIAYDVESLTDKEGRYILSMNPDTLKRRIEEDG